jgi:hypothetical protein
LLVANPSTEEKRLPQFWLRTGFDESWKLNNDVRTREKELILQAMKATGKIVNQPAGHFSLLIPFEAENSEANVISGMIERIIALRDNLKALLPPRHSDRDLVANQVK